jgi:hypothetical protein
MGKGRLEAFSDGVIAVIITIMVLEMKVLTATSRARSPLFPVFLSYVLSYVYVGIYWNNHHHMMHAVKTVHGPVLWANLHLLFWLSLIPCVTGWMGENHFAEIPVALYGAILMMCGIAYFILGRPHATTAAARVAHCAWSKDFQGIVSVVICGGDPAILRESLARVRDVHLCRDHGSFRTAGSSASSTGDVRPSQMPSADAATPPTLAELNQVLADTAFLQPYGFRGGDGTGECTLLVPFRKALERPGASSAE